MSKKKTFKRFVREEVLGVKPEDKQFDKFEDYVKDVRGYKPPENKADSFEQFLKETKGYEPPEHKYDSFEQMKEEAREETKQQLLEERKIYVEPTPIIITDEQIEKANRALIFKEINEVLKFRDPVLEKMTFKQWLKIPHNKFVFELDEHQADLLYEQDMWRAEKYQIATTAKARTGRSGRAGGGGVRKRKTAVAAWKPSDLEGLSLWLDADDASTITESGGAISGWTNKAPAPYAGLFDLTQSSAASQPAFVTDGQNGRSVVRFDTTVDEELNGVGSDAYQTPASSGNELTLFTVCRFTTGHSITRAYISGIIGWALDSNYKYVPVLNRHFNFGDSEGYGGSRGITALNTKPPYDRAQLQTSFTETNKIYTFRNQATAPLRIDGDGSLTLDRNDCPLVGLNLSDTTRKWLTVGRAYADSYANNFDGDICEIICYAANLSDADTETVEEYLADKWGITLP